MTQCSSRLYSIVNVKFTYMLIVIVNIISYNDATRNVIHHVNYNVLYLIYNTYTYNYKILSNNY